MDWVKIGKGCLESAIDVLDSMDAKIVKNKDNVQLDADLKSEKAIIDFLKKNKVECTIYSEEKTKPIVIGEQNEHSIIIDPLDNSHLFLRGEKSFCSSAMMILKNSIPIYAFVKDISTRDIYYCDEKNAYKNNKKIEVPKKIEGKNLILGWAPYKLRAERFFNKLIDLTKDNYYIYNFGGQLQAVKIVCGAYDAYVEVRAEKLEEFCAALIVEKAGGIISDLKGDPIQFDPKKMQTLLVARNEEIHKKILNQFMNKK